MSKIRPTPHTWTLRFKNQRTTILLEVDPLQQFSDIRTELLLALQETNPTGKINGKDIPKNADHIKLGRAVDRNKLKLGFVSLGDNVEQSTECGKGKGKSAIGSGKAKAAAANGITDCPQGHDIRSGDVLAFKFVTHGEDLLDENEEGEDVKWDVEIPTLEDTYGGEGVVMEEG